MRSRSALLSAALLVAVLPGLPSASAERAAADQCVGSENLTFVANLPHAPNARGQNAKGSDVEFADLDVTGLPGAPEGVEGVREFAVAGTINIDGVANSGMQIIDITDPTKPTRAGLFECTNGQGDIQVFTRDDMPGRTFATYTTDSSGTTSSPCYQAAAEDKGFNGEDSGTFIVDITNPYAPELVYFVEIRLGSHNQTVHPSGRYLYNSNNELTRPGTAAIEYIDITDLTAPKQLGTIPLQSGLDAHDITFNESGTRAYAASITHTVIIDTTDPTKPSVIGRIVDPTLGIQHQSDPVTIEDPVLGKRTFLAITDEFAGAAGNGFCPGGGVGIYDITGDLEKNPVRVGYWNIPEFKPAGGGVAGTSLRCTSHVLRFYPEEKLMTIGWYNAGVRVVDISGLVGAAVGVSPAVGNVGPGMREVAYRYLPNSESWTAKVKRFEEDGSAYLFSNDITRGFDVFRYEADAPASTDGGTWLNAAEMAARPQYEMVMGNLMPLCASPA